MFTGGLAPQQLNRVREYITANLGKDISLTDLAGLVNLSKFYFLRAFKKTTGIAPYQFILSRRVDPARSCLLNVTQLLLWRDRLAFTAHYN